MRTPVFLSLAASVAGLLGGARVARPARAVRPHIRAVTEAPVPELPATQRQVRDKLHVRIDDEWYDLTNWRMAHPAGAHWIDAYKDSDATEVMYGFHSDKGMGMIKRLGSEEPRPGRGHAAQTSSAEVLRNGQLREEELSQDS